MQADFAGGTLTSDAGGLLLREVDRRLGLLDALTAGLSDPRDPARITHDLRTMLAQRSYALALGYEDLNDYTSAAADYVRIPSSPCWPSSDRTWSNPPRRLVLDFDATDDPGPGAQEGRFFHGYYDHYCFRPRYVFCSARLLVADLRPSNIDASLHTGPILKLLVHRRRQAWPQVRIIRRGAAGFCRGKLRRWCERNGVFYVLGLARNNPPRRTSPGSPSAAADSWRPPRPNSRPPTRRCGTSTRCRTPPEPGTTRGA